MSVGEEINKNLANALGINQVKLFIETVLNAEDLLLPLLFHLDLNKLEACHNDFVKVRRNTLDLEFTRLDLEEIESVVH